MGNPGGESKGSNSTQRGLHPPLPVQTQPNQITNCLKQLCQPSQKSQPFGGPVSAGEQKCSRTGRKSKLSGVLQPAIFGTQIQQPVETYLGPEHIEHLPKHRVVQNGDPRDNKNLPTGRGVGNLHRFQGNILPHTNSQSIQEVHETHTVALEEQLEGTRITRKGDTSCLYQHGRGDVVGPSVCPSVENPDVVYQETGNTQLDTSQAG